MLIDYQYYKILDYSTTFFGLHETLGIWNLFIINFLAKGWNYSSNWRYKSMCNYKKTIYYSDNSTVYLFDPVILTACVLPKLSKSVVGYLRIFSVVGNVGYHDIMQLYVLFNPILKYKLMFLLPMVPLPLAIPFFSPYCFHAKQLRIRFSQVKFQTLNQLQYWATYCFCLYHILCSCGISWFFCLFLVNGWFITVRNQHKILSSVSNSQPYFGIYQIPLLLLQKSAPTWKPELSKPFDNSPKCFFGYYFCEIVNTSRPPRPLHC